jgi:bacterioferritin-associated ferredoxin
VGLTAIRDALQTGAATGVESIGAALRAGTNCGSCLPELKRIVADVGAAAPAGAGSARMILPRSDLGAVCMRTFG